MNETYAVISEESPDPEDIRQVRRGLGRFNREAGNIINYKDLVLFVRDAGGRIVGGLIGCTLGTLLLVETLWLEEELRGKGYGSRLLQVAEEEALARGCRVAELMTFSWQAPEFYKKKGYAVFGELEEVGAGHTAYFFRKYLRKPS